MAFRTSPSLQQYELQHERKKMVARFVVFVLMACSAILLFNSYRLESVRFEALIRNSATKFSNSRALPEENHNLDISGGKVGNERTSELYVPSLDFRIKGISQYSSIIPRGVEFDAHVYCEEFEKDLLWEWWQPTKQKEQQQQQQIRHLRKEDPRINRRTIGSRTTRKRLLIGVSAGYNNLAKLLERAVWSARVYGTLWSESSSSSTNGPGDMDITVVTLQGTAFSPHGCKAPSSHWSIDKIRVLFEAIDSGNQYDQLLLLDPDAMIYDMDTDLTSLFDDNDDFVVAGPVILTEEGKKDKYMPWKIASGMTLWNLEHPSTQAVASDWFRYAKNAFIRGTYQYDQKYLHKALQNYYNTNKNGIVARNNDRDGIVQALMDHEFDGDAKGTIIKQFGVTKTVAAGVAENVHDKQVKARLIRMEETARQICDRYPDACNRVGAPPRYDVS